MNVGLFVLGILIIAGVFYFINIQPIASLLSLQQFAYAVGFVLLLVGLVMPGGKRERQAVKETVKSKSVEEEESEEEPEEEEEDEESEEEEEENEKKPNKYCGNCGAKITSNVKFCPKCGKKL